MVLTAANVHDSKVFEELVDAVEPIKRPGRGRPRKRPEKLHADKAYDYPRCRDVFAASRHQGPHRKERKRRQRAAGAAQVGGGAHAGVAGALSQALGALREASGYPRGTTLPRMRARLPMLRSSTIARNLSDRCETVHARVAPLLEKTKHYSP